jgi:hypothetical protein
MKGWLVLVLSSLGAWGTYQVHDGRNGACHGRSRSTQGAGALPSRHRCDNSMLQFSVRPQLASTLQQFCLLLLSPQLLSVSLLCTTCHGPSSQPKFCIHTLSINLSLLNQANVDPFLKRKNSECARALCSCRENNSLCRYSSFWLGDWPPERINVVIGVCCTLPIDGSGMGRKEG